MLGNIDEAKEEISRKRGRLSRKDQKALKKQRKCASATASATATLTAAAIVSVPSSVTDKTTVSQSPSKVETSTQSIDFLSNYKAIPTNTKTKSNSSTSSVSLGKWFPKATTMKSKLCFSNDTPSSAKASLVLFYQYTTWKEEQVKLILDYLQLLGQTRILGGRIRVAPEGVNATVTSVDGPDTTAANTIRHFIQDLQSFDEVFQNTDFKVMDDLSADRHFKDFKLLPVKELVFYGIREKEAPLQNGGTHISAKEFHAKLEEEHTVVVDVRNHYEADIGRFDGQTLGELGGSRATYIDPKMRKSTDFTSWLAKPETKAQLKEKQVLLFCTGGVRCERASAYLKQQMGDSVKGCYQLQGGVERYLQSFDDGGYWRGKNFVFDKREAIGPGNRNGDGGIVNSNKAMITHENTTSTTAATSSVGAHCCLCNKPWDRYIGKKKCHMCGVPVLMCDSCLSTQKKDGKDVARCPLCIAEDITVPAADVEYTNNGVGVRGGKIVSDEKRASSVLKWGGGHATEKKDHRKWKRRLCQFGSECRRLDCFFAHPERKPESTCR